MKFTIYADTHLGSPIEMKPEGLFIASENKILLGDIVDLANCKKMMTEYYKELHDELKLIHGDNYIRGNHERTMVLNETIIKTTESGVRICFVHGDIEANPERWTKYRMKSHGAGFFKRKFIVPFIREAEEIIERKPKKEVLDRMCAKANSHNCSVYIGGHFHPEKTLEIMHTFMGKAYKIIIVPRGKTELEIE